MRPRPLLCILAIISTALPSSWAKHYTAAELKGMFIEMPAPDYPIEMRRLRVEGRGVFRLSVDEQGRVTSVTVVKSTRYRTLDKSCLKAFRHWQATPGTKREVDVPVRFTMKSSFPDFYLKNG
jgi:TonB family protein